MLADPHANKYRPVNDPVSLAYPTAKDLALDATLKAFMDENIVLETMSEMSRRNEILAEVKTIFVKWVQHVAINILHIPEEEAVEAGGELFISGSHKLGVREPGADIDTVCVAPRFCTREHFFTSLKDVFLNHPDVAEFNSIETAAIPLLSFEFRGVSIDLLFAHLAYNTVPKDLDILDDNILRNLDDATEKSLNGPRVTNMITKLVGAHAFDNFLIVLRCIRKWAKERGIYGNKLGYLGGVNCNLLVVFICQLFPNMSPSQLLYRFFLIYKTWKWPSPILLNAIQPNPAGESRDIWSRNDTDLMPIITPAYPAMNSSYSVSYSSLEVMKNEFKRGEQIVKRILDEGGKNWTRLFESSDFFIKYNYYLSCNIIGHAKNDEASRSWIGFVESRLRRLPTYMMSLDDQLSSIHLHPVVFKTKKSEHSICYFIGFNINTTKFKNNTRNSENKKISLEYPVDLFWKDLRKYSGPQNDFLDFSVDCLKWSNLPKEVFDSIGGVEIGKKKRFEYSKLKLAELAAAMDTEKGASKGAQVTEEGTEGDKSTGMRKRKIGGSEEPPASAVQGVASGGDGERANWRLFSRVPIPKLTPPVLPWELKSASQPYRVPTVVSWTVIADPK